MDFIRFLNPANATLFGSAKLINGIESKTWIERYRDAGEFTLIGNADSGLRELLPVGSFISHLDTSEIMIVESHEINRRKGSEPEITITGRGFETYFENRIVGTNKVFPTVTAGTEYALAADQTWDQAVLLLSDHLIAANTIDDGDALQYLDIRTNIVGAGTTVARTIPRGNLHQKLLELLAVDDLGVKVIRPGPWSPISPTTAFGACVLIHRGVDRAATVSFSYDAGEIESADYLWTNKKRKTAAYITGKWVETMVSASDVEYFRRVIHVDASDVDQEYTVAPAGGDLSAVVTKMQQRGFDALAASKDLALVKAEVSQESVRAKYRVDYDVGDTVTVYGDYGETSTMRVSEHVEIEDKDGFRSYPTLAVVN